MLQSDMAGDTPVSLDDALTAAMQSVPNCVAAGYIDMQTGFLLGLEGRDDDSMAALENMSTSIANLILGQGISAFEKLLSSGEESQGSGFGEIAIYSGDRLYLLLRRADQPDHVVCFVSKGHTNVGLALAKSTSKMNMISAAV
ncbi:hypothetical protein [Aliiroseovarius halocynthiae]|uniref:Roadblock/LAMTOR2 domain-containing protein n=1 Tax=Aliiroseovarius halocynthiae TaxID=985055 RepID=A0A545SPE8_9RHOB|nr:hypothetical protein [Aliiroseovarius halocynthiae]TQV66831.1 hypothetical protein FIL88_12105 [Aliiroseovarius halocynthiae]